MNEENVINITAWRERQQQWAQFADWEAKHKSKLSPAEALRWAGGALALYLERNRPAERPGVNVGDVQGIIEMHRLLNCWSHS